MIKIKLTQYYFYELLKCFHKRIPCRSGSVSRLVKRAARSIQRVTPSFGRDQGPVCKLLLFARETPNIPRYMVYIKHACMMEYKHFFLFGASNIGKVLLSVKI